MNIFRLPAIKSTFVFSNKQHQTPCHSPYLPVGKTSLFTKYISYLFFDLSTLPKEQVISSAMLKIYFNAPPCKGDPPAFLGIQALAKPFEDCYTNYTSKPPMLAKTLKRVPLRKNCCSISVDITTLVKAWHAGKLMNSGLALVPIDLETCGVLLFHSSNTPDHSRHPLLIVTTEPPKTNCYERKEYFSVGKRAGFSSTQEVWGYSIYSFIVANSGSKSTLVKLQASPNQINFIDEEPEIELFPGQTRVFVSNFFTRYNRLTFRLASQESGTGQIKIWLQARV